MFCGIVAVRSLLLDNMLLTLDVQKRSVELGAVSSLLTVCYDAVLEVDQALTLTQDAWREPYVKRVASCGVLLIFVEGPSNGLHLPSNPWHLKS